MMRRSAIAAAVLSVLFGSSLFAQMNWTRTAGVWWSARWRHASVAFNNELWVMGGFDGNRRNDVWHSPDGQVWTQSAVGSMWGVRERFPALVYNSAMWVLGGYDGVFRRNDIWYSPDGSTWNQVSQAGRRWSVRERHGAVVFNGKLWVLGGYDGSFRKNDVWSSTDGGITWDSMAVADSIWAPREHFAVAAFNNELWVIGGWNGTTYYNDAWHSPDGVTWRHATAAAGWTARYGLTSVVQGGMLWIIGGEDATDALFDVWGSTDGANWVRFSAGVSALGRFSHTAVVMNGRMWVLGGGELPARRFNEVWNSLDGINWAPSLWSARNSHRALAGLGAMWVLGGEDDDGLAQSDVWESSDGARWSQVKANAWPGRLQFGAVFYHNRLWIMGGGTLSDVYCSTDGSVWTLATGGAAWPARDGFPVLSYHDTMWLLGGRTSGSIAANDVWWSTDGANWTLRPGIGGKWSARYYHTALVFKDTMWVMGGTTGTTPQRDVWWSRDGAHWTQRTATAGWSARSLHASEVYDGKMWVLGGNDGNDRHDAWYSTDGTNWTQAAAASEWAVRIALAAVTFNDRLWVMGGYNTSSNTNDQDVWRYVGPPGIPILVSPANGASNLPVNGLLRWNVEPRSASYDIYLDTLNPPSALLAANQTGTSLPFSGLAGAHTYYWRVIGKNVNGTTSSATWSFLTMAGAPNWTRLLDVPPGSRSRGVKDGGALTWGRELGNDTALVYALKGNSSYEFYRYNTAGNAWLALESINAVNRLGKKKTVKKGGTLVMAGDGRLYATKGNNTYDWWQYDPAKPWGSRWAQMTDVPTGYKSCREGVSTAAVQAGGVNYVYLLKGSGTFEFDRYSTATNSWEAMANAPSGPLSKSYKKGSCIVYDGVDTIYCLKATYDEFYVYSVSGRTWQTRDTLPRGSFRKKVADGAAMACAGGAVFTLKGNNTNEMWLYPDYDHAWQQGTSMTAGAKKVKAGGALVSVPDRNGLFAFRGNNTREFWMYGPVAADYLHGVDRRNEVLGQSAARSPEFVLSVAPNPLTPSSNPSIFYSLPVAGDASLKLYDVTGKLVSLLVSGYRPAGSCSYSLLAAHCSLASGIYVVRLETRGNRLTTKLIIE